jgi:hypothetical protein
MGVVYCVKGYYEGGVPKSAESFLVWLTVSVVVFISGGDWSHPDDYPESLLGEQKANLAIISAWAFPVAAFPSLISRKFLTLLKFRPNRCMKLSHSLSRSSGPITLHPSQAR